MNIGIDAKWYFDGPPSGKIVIRNLIEQIVRNYPEHHFTVFLDARFRSTPVTFRSANVSIDYVWGGINLISNALVLPWAARKHRLDCIVYQYFGPVFSSSASIVFIHDVIFETDPHHFTFIERLYFVPMKFLAKRAEAIVTVSENEKKRLIAYRYGTEDNISVVYNGVSKEYHPRSSFSEETISMVKKKYGLPDRFLLYVGRLNDRKNLKNLIAAVSMINDASIPLLLFGSYQWKSIDLHRIISDLNMQERVFLKGFADQEDLPVIYSLATVFTFVSYEEGFGLPVVEALASDIPCVVADVPVFRELFNDSVFYADPHDPASIADQIRILVTDEQQALMLRSNGVKRASEFSWERSTASLMDSILRAKG